MHRNLFLFLLFGLAALVTPQVGASPPAPVEDVEELAEGAAAAAAAGDSSMAAEASEAEAVESIESIQSEEPVEAAGPEDDAPQGGSGGSSVQWVVTAKMKAKLTELGYDEAEIAELEPERAAAIIRHSISRPNKGVPTSWNKGVRRSAVGAGRGLLGKIGKATRLPSSALAPVALLVGGVGAVSLGLVHSFGTSKATNAALTAEPLEPADEPEVPIQAPGAFESSEELWLDRQIDRLIFFLKRLLGR
jgi:hypothetical protein